jgi:tetratricopeptide (TPR) repeat protein
MTVTAFQQANQLLREGKLEEAVVAYQQAIEQNPNSYLSYQNLGETLGKLGRWGEALEAYRRAVQLKPDAAWSNWGLSQALQQMGRVEEAQQLHQRAVEIDPKLGKLFFAEGSLVKKAVSSSLLKTPVQSDTASAILQRSQEKIRQFHNKHWGERCVIIGNGPSLNEMDLSFLKHEVCFGTNKIYLGFDRWGFSPTYYVAVNPFVIEQSVNEIRRISCPKFIGNRGISYFDAADDIIFIRTLPPPDESFSERADVGFNEGSTVTYVAMQLAYYMGFSEVVLIGVDHHFVTQGTPHQPIVSDGNDPNHFDPNYFGKGLTWQLPDLENSQKSYQVAKQVFEESGRKIIDATVNGRCQVFPKQDYKIIFKESLFKTSSLLSEKSKYKEILANPGMNISTSTSDQKALNINSESQVCVIQSWEKSINKQKKPLSKVIVLWIGRFTGVSGYGFVAKTYVDALRINDVSVVTIDINLLQVVGPPISSSLHIEKNSDCLEIKSNDPNVSFIVVFNDTPEKLHRIKASGRTRLVCSTMFETESIPFNWYDPLLNVDEIWVPSDFNKETFSSAGIPKFMINSFPLCINSSLYSSEHSKLLLPGLKAFIFLNVVSNFNRKDIGLLLRSYFKSFKKSDDVSLIIKIPPKLSDEVYDQYFYQAVLPEFSIGSPNLPHFILLKEYLSEERMRSLYKTCDTYISLERGKGWDLPAMEAMAMGKPTIGINWSANTEFMNFDNSYLIDPLSERVFVEENLAENLILYAGHKWSSVNEDDVVNMMKLVYEAEEDRKIKGSKAQKYIRKNFSQKVVGEKIKAKIEKYEAYDFRSHNPPSLILHKSSISEKKVPDNQDYPVLTSFREGDSLEDWVQERRRLWGQFNGIPPVSKEIERLRSLKDAYSGERIFIIGNGPSLNQVDLNKLKNEYTFATNKIYLLFEKIQWRPTFYTCLDWRVVPDSYDIINNLKGEGITFFFPNRFNGLLRNGEDVFWYYSKSPGGSIKEKFETDITKGVRGGGTVLVAAIQIAFYLGFREIYLTGVDASYSIQKTVIQRGEDRFGTGIKINLESTKDDDINHFDTRYFGRGAKWHDPNVNEMIRGFLNCRKAIEINGGNFYNATVGGKLEVLERVNINDFYR